MKFGFLTGWFAVIGFYVAGISPAGGNFLPQLATISLLLIFSFIVHINFSEDNSREEQKVLFWVLGIFCSYISALNSAVYDNYQLISYSILFTLIMFSAKSVATKYDFHRLASFYVYACALLVLTLVVLDFDSIRRALSATQTSKGLYRLTMFGNHPNLVGHFIGTTAALLVARILRIDTKPNYLASIPLLLVFSIIILATSSRGTVLALLITSVTVFFITRPKAGVFPAQFVRSRTLVLYSALLAILAFLFFKFGYILEILDINSTSRGINSGGTGRFQNWATFVEMIQDQPFVFFFGHGFRSWPATEIGFDSDNSYIVLIYEIGLPLTLLVVFLLLRVLISAVRNFDSRTMSPEMIAVLSFALIESIFSRYLISIGNPASFIILVALLAVQIPPLEARKIKVI